MPAIQLPRETLLDIMDEEVNVLVDEIVDTSRWSIQYDFVFKYQGKIYQTGYQVGATEQQDEGPWEYDKVVACYEVEPYEKTVTEYRLVEQCSVKV